MQGAGRILCDNLEGWGGVEGGGWEAEEGGDICILMTDPRCCMGRNQHILKQSSSN